MNTSCCPDCGVSANKEHLAGCEHIDNGHPVWDGQWPGSAECFELGLYCRSDGAGGFIECTKDHPDAAFDLNRYRSIQFVTDGLVLALTAPTDAQAAEAANLAEKFARGMTQQDVNHCKERALERWKQSHAPV